MDAKLKRLTPQQLAVRELNELINTTDKVYIMRQFFADGDMTIQVSVKKADTLKATNVTAKVAQAFGVPIKAGRGMLAIEYALIIEMCENIHSMPFEISRIEVRPDLKIIDYSKMTTGKVNL